MTPMEVVEEVRCAVIGMADFIFERLDEDDEWVRASKEAADLGALLCRWQTLPRDSRADEREYWAEAEDELREALDILQPAVENEASARDVWQLARSAGCGRHFSSLRDLCCRVARLVVRHSLGEAVDTLSSWGNADRALLRRIKTQIHYLAVGRRFSPSAFRVLSSVIQSASEALNDLADGIRCGEVTADEEDEPAIPVVEEYVPDEADDGDFLAYRDWHPADDLYDAEDDEEDGGLLDDDEQEEEEEMDYLRYGLPDPDGVEADADQLEEDFRMFLCFSEHTEDLAE